MQFKVKSAICIADLKKMVIANMEVLPSKEYWTLNSVLVINLWNNSPPVQLKILGSKLKAYLLKYGLYDQNNWGV